MLVDEPLGHHPHEWIRRRFDTEVKTPGFGASELDMPVKIAGDDVRLVAVGTDEPAS